MFTGFLEPIGVCYRCGNEYERTSNHANISIYQSYPNVIQNGNLIILCPECQEELKTWIEKGVNNGKA